MVVLMALRQYVLVLCLAAMSMGQAAPAPSSPTPQPGAPARRIIRINAERFVFFPSRITITAGEEVEFRVKSDDTLHGFRIVGGDVNMAIPKRGKGEATVVVRLQEPGRYRFECSRMCGAGHNFMRGELIVREADGGSTR
jgi:heme/copper-type cytochrome/quinol oxidase subunit 2